MPEPGDDPDRTDRLDGLDGLAFAATLVVPETGSRSRSGQAARAATAAAPYRSLPVAPPGSSVPDLVRHLARRGTLRRGLRPSGVRVPLPPASLRSGLRASVRRWLLSGVLVLPSEGGFPPPSSPLGRVVADAGLRLPEPRLWAGSGGSLVAPALRDEDPVVLRVYPGSAVEQHAHAQRTLTHLETHAVRWAPRLQASGVTQGLLWLVESRLPGRRPRRLSDRLCSQVLEFCVGLPPADGPAGAPHDRLPDVLEPGTAARLRRLGREAATAWSGAPATGTHGDLWEGNLLQAGKDLGGVVDWDAYRSDLVPGVDLVHLVATADRLRHRRSMGAELLTRPWSREPLRTLASRYFDRMGHRVDEERWTATGVAWWLGQLSDTLGRTPGLARDAAWVQRNVESVLGQLG